MGIFALTSHGSSSANMGGSYDDDDDDYDKQQYCPTYHASYDDVLYWQRLLGQ